MEPTKYMLVVTTFGEFRVVAFGEYSGPPRIVYQDSDLQSCINGACQSIGHPIAFELVRPPGV